MGILAIIVSIVSLGLMIGLHLRTKQFQKSVANDNRNTLEFMVNLIINAAADPDIVRRLVLDYEKEMRWRAGIFYRGDKHHSIGWEMPAGPKEIKIGNMKIAVIRPSGKGKNTSS